MELSKAEMEDIWSNKPVGYLSSLKKSLKGTKMYKIKLTPLRYTELTTEVYTVRARNVDEAQMNARQEWYTKYSTVHGRPDAWRYNNVT